LWVLAAAVYLFLITPVDMLVVRYNVRRILEGDPAPSVEISFHPIDADGVLQFRPLLECRDVTIREGVRALIAQWQYELERRESSNQSLGWTTYQIAAETLLRDLREHHNLAPYNDLEARQMALKNLREYAFQWY